MRDNFNVHEWNIQRIREEKNISGDEAVTKTIEFLRKSIYPKLTDDEMDKFVVGICEFMGCTPPSYRLNEVSSKEKEIYAKIEKLRVLSNSGKITGDQFLDKFYPLARQLKGMNEPVNEDKADAVRWFGNLKYYYQKAFAELKGEDRETYKQLAKDFFSKLEIDDKVRPVGLDEDEGTLNKIADMLSRKFDDLRFDVSTQLDRIDVRGSQQDLTNFGDKLHGKKIFDYEVFATDDDDRGEIVRIVKSDSISKG